MTTATAVRAPFPWPGNKTRAAVTLWSALGTVRALFDPFAGSLATYLSCPHRDDLRHVILGDADASLINLWRALQHDPTVLTEARAWPVDNLTNAATDELVRHVAPAVLPDVLRDSAWAFDRAVAVATLWRFCRAVAPTPRTGIAHGMSRRSLPHRVDPDSLAAALDGSRVTLHHGPWQDVVTDGRINEALHRSSPVAVILDPPYPGHEDDYPTNTHGRNGSVAADVYQWAVEHGEHPQVRIVACGLAGDGQVLLDAGWREWSWVRRSGHTRHRERLWLSPSCPAGDGPDLFDAI